MWKAKAPCRYVASVEFLKIHMDFLRSKSKAIRQDAFHVFKVFAANPKKAPKVTFPAEMFCGCNVVSA